MFAGIDVGKVDDFTAVVVLDDLVVKGCWKVANGQTWDQQLAIVAGKVKGCRLAAVDATGMGSMFAESLGKYVPVIPFTFTSMSKPVLIGLLVEAMNGGLRVEPGAEGADILREELVRFGCESTRTGWKFSGKEGGKDDAVMALALALLARNRGQVTATPRRETLASPRVQLSTQPATRRKI